jgi:hypothetical protein
MNVQKLFDALRQDQNNSALGIICSELETQGYKVAIDGVKVNSDGFFNEKYPEIEKKMKPLKISLFREGTFEQEFIIEFTDFHEFIIKQKGD